MASSFLWKKEKPVGVDIGTTVQASTSAHCGTHLSLTQLRGRCPHPGRLDTSLSYTNIHSLTEDDGQTQSHWILSARFTRHLEDSKKVILDEKSLMPTGPHELHRKTELLSGGQAEKDANFQLKFNCWPSCKNTGVDNLFQIWIRGCQQGRNEEKI